MSTPSEVTVDTVLQQAQMLSPEQRWLLLERLEAMQAESHRPPPGADRDTDEWISTIRRRAEEMRNGTAKTVSLDEAVKEARSRFL